LFFWKWRLIMLPPSSYDSAVPIVQWITC
jgi:hypothetical protein